LSSVSVPALPRGGRHDTLTCLPLALRPSRGPRRRGPWGGGEPLRAYEAAIVFRPELDGEALERAIERVARVVRERGGEPGTPERWGRRRLAYEIQHMHEGVYVFLPFKAGNGVVPEVERHLRISDDVLRYMVVRPTENPPPRAAQPTSAAPEAAASPTEASPGEAAPAGATVPESGNAG
jgi:small subunit ribosomal protein S6